jgi:hypothetical protein
VGIGSPISIGMGSGIVIGIEYARELSKNESSM